jgi:hypothetical protein
MDRLLMSTSEILEGQFLKKESEFLIPPSSLKRIKKENGEFHRRLTKKIEYMK